MAELLEAWEFFPESAQSAYEIVTMFMTSMLVFVFLTKVP